MAGFKIMTQPPPSKITGKKRPRHLDINTIVEAIGDGEHDLKFPYDVTVLKLSAVTQHTPSIEQITGNGMSLHTLRWLAR